MLQEYLEGFEYVVNCVTREGKSKCTDFWRFHSDIVYGKCDIWTAAELVCPSNDEALLEIVNYAHSVLHCLEVVNGASHLEIKMVSRGPLLVDANLRLAGWPLSTWQNIQKVTGYTQITALIDSWYNAGSFSVLPAVVESISSQLLIVFVHAPRVGVVVATDTNLLSQIKLLEAFVFASLPEIGVRVSGVSGPGNLSVSGTLVLVHPDVSVIQANVLAAIELVKNLLHVSVS